MISVAILTKNEEAEIKECLDSLKFADDVIVIDDFSNDDTAKIAQSMGVKVFRSKLNGDFSKQRNFAISKAKNEWVLFVDADERVPEKLKEEILRAIKENKDVSAFSVKRDDYFLGKLLKHGETGNIKLVRLIKKGSGKWTRSVHETYKTGGIVVNLEYALKHYSHKNIRGFVKSINMWSTLHANANNEEGKRSDLYKIVFYPPAHFLNNYFFKMGFLDGLWGFAFAVIMSFHSFLAWSKLWMLQKGYTRI